MALAEQLVLDPEQLLALDGEVAAAGEAHRLAAGGPVERLGDRRPPVDHDRFAVSSATARRPMWKLSSASGDSAYRSMRPNTSDEFAEIEVGEPLDQRLVERVALETGLERAAEVGLGHVAHAPRSFTTGVQTVVRVIDVRLLFGEIRVLLGHRPRSRTRRPTSAESGE